MIKPKYTPIPTYQSALTYQPQLTYQPETTYKQDVRDEQTIVKAEYNDPKQINTVLDVLFNEAALRDRYDSIGFKARIKAVSDMISEQYLNPALKGQWGTVGMNTLYSFGETVDVLGNVVKAFTTPLINDKSDQVDYEYAEQALTAVATGSVKPTKLSDGSNSYLLMLDGKLNRITDKDLKMYENVVNSGRTVNYAKLTTSERFKASIGIGEYGRINYEYATGNMFSNLLLEVVSDPGTWATLGTTAIAKTATKATTSATQALVRNLDEALTASIKDPDQMLQVKAAIETFAKNANDSAVMRDAINSLSTRQIKSIANSGDKEWLDLFLGPAVKEGKLHNTYGVQTLADAMTVSMKSKGLLPDLDNVTAGMMSTILERTVGTAVNRVTIKALRVTDAADRGMDSMFKALARISLTPSGIYPVYKLLKQSPAVARHVSNILSNASAINNNKLGDRSIMSYDDGLKNHNDSVQVVKDMLAGEPDLYVNFESPEYMRQFHSRMAKDTIILSDIVERYANNPEDATAMLRKYLVNAHHGTTLGGLHTKALTIQKQQQLLGSFDPVLDEYIKFVDDVKTSFIPKDGQLKVQANVKALQEFEDQFKIQNKFVLDTFTGEGYSERAFVVLSAPNWIHAVGDLHDDMLLKVNEIHGTLTAQLNALREVHPSLDEGITRTLADLEDNMDQIKAHISELLELDSAKKASKHLRATPDLNILLEQSLGEFADSVLNYSNLFYKPLKGVLETKTSLQRLLIESDKATNNSAAILQVLSKTKQAVNNNPHLKVPYTGYRLTPSDLLQNINAKYNDGDSKNLRRLIVEATLHRKETANIASLDIVKASMDDIADLSEWHGNNIDEWLTTPFNNVGYIDAWNNATRSIEELRADYNLASTKANDEHNALSLERMRDVIEKLEKAADFFRPSDDVQKKYLLDADQTYIALKYEQLHATLMMTENPNMQAVMSELRAGDIRKYMDMLFASETTDNEAKLIIQEVLNTVDQFYSNRALLQQLYSAPETELSSSAKQGVFSALQKLYKLTPDRFLANIDGHIEDVFENAEGYIQQSRDAGKSLSLDGFKRSKTPEELAAFRTSVGLSAEVGHSHEAVEDIYTDLYLLHDLAERGDELARNIIDTNRRVIGIDIESQNVQLDTRNTLHQLGTVVFEGGKVVKSSSVGLDKDIIRANYMPNYSYIHNKLGIDADKYLERVAGEFKDEASLLVERIKNMYDSVADTYDETTDSFSAVLLTHNGKGFDLKLLQNKIKQYELAPVLREMGIDPGFINKCVIYDTLEHSRTVEGYFVLTTAEKQRIAEILKTYAENMNNASAQKLFSSTSPQELRVIKDFCANQGSLSKDQGMLDVFTDIAAKVTDTFQVFTEIKEANRAFRKELIPKGLMTNTIDADGVSSMPESVKKLWLDFFRSIMPEDKFNRIFGDGSSLNASKILGAIDGQQALAYKYGYDGQLVSDFFISDVKQITRLQASQRMGVARSLKRTVEKVKYPEQYIPYRAQMEATIQEMLKEPGLQYMANARTANLNIQQTYALFRYLVLHHPDQKNNPERLSALLGEELYSVARQPIDYLDYNGMNKYAKRLAEGEYFNNTLQYNSQIEAMLSLKKDIADQTRYLDEKGFANAATQLSMKASTAAANMLQTFVSIGNKLDRVSKRALHHRVASYTNEVKANIVRNFAMQAPDDMAQWLASSHGFVAIAKGDKINYAKLLQKLNAAEYVAANIRTLDDGEHIWVWLTKDAKWDCYLDNETSKFIYNVNGKEAGRFNWAQFNPSDVARIVDDAGIDPAEAKKFVDEFTEAYDRLQFITEDAAGASVFDNFNTKTLGEVLYKMPKEMKESFYNDVFLMRAHMWQGAQYNHTLLGSNNSVVQMYNNDLISSIAESTKWQVQQRATATVYTQALLDESSGIANTELAQAFAESPKEVLKYLKDHGEITLVVPQASDKGKFGVRVTEVKIKNEADLQYAFANNARIMTSTVYNKLYEVLNENIYSEGLMGKWQSLLRLYKIGYLLTPGTWGRNASDAFIKNMMAADEGPIKTGRFYKTALKDYNAYNDAVADLYRLGQGKMPPADEIEAFFKGNKRLDYGRYQYIHNFMMTSASGGEASVYAKMHKTQQKDYMDTLLADGGITSEAARRANSARTFEHITSMALAPMGLVEKISRLAEYDMLTTKGYNTSKAIDVVERTHFSYATKTPVEQTMELIVPFYTFISRNFEFWVDMLDANPGYFSIMRDVATPMWDLGQYDPDELIENDGLNRQVMAGNIPIGDTGYFLSNSFSFMDALGWMTDPFGSSKSAVFSPISTVLNVALQHMSDYSYTSGAYDLSEWVQNTFGGDRSLAQLQDMYGGWTDTYRELYGDMSARKQDYEKTQRIAFAISLIPAIGSLLSRFYKTGVYYNDENTIGQLVYASSLATKTTLWDQDAPYVKREVLRNKLMAYIGDSSTSDDVWQELLKKFNLPENVSLYQLDGDILDKLYDAFREQYKKLNSRLYEAMQHDDNSLWTYTRLRNALGYNGVQMKDLPQNVREAILSVMNGMAPTVDVMPVLQDGDAMNYMWQTLCRKFEVSSNFSEIPDETLNKMYLEIAKSSATLSSIMTMLNEDETTRFSYAVAKNKLGLKDIKLSYLPGEALDVIEHAMKVRYYGTGYSSETRAAGATSRKASSPRKIYHKMSYIKGSGNGLYDTSKGVHANYGHRAAQKTRIYDKHYTSTGFQRMEIRMMPMNPVYLKYRRKDMYYYFK